MQKGLTLSLIILGILVLIITTVGVFDWDKQTTLPTLNPIIMGKLNFETIPVRNFTDNARNITKPMVINDVDSWVKIVNQPEIGIDFKNETVIAVFMSGMTGGYDIQVKEVTDKGYSVDVLIVKTRPGKNCAVTQAITFNSHIVKLQKISKVVNFIVQEETRDCKH